MARKKLLTEGEIRQFMKLANLRPLGQSRLSEMGAGGYGGGMEPGQRDDEMGEEMPADDMAPEGDEEMDLGDMGAEDDMDMDMDMPDEGGGDMVSMSDFMDALEMAIEDVTGEPASVEEAPGEGEPRPEEEMDLDADVDMGGEDDMGADMGDEEEPPGMRYESKEDEIVAEVARRVAARLQSQNRKEQMVDQLAERIMKRLTK
jgi:hypothetical protein